MYHGDRRYARGGPTHAIDGAGGSSTTNTLSFPRPAGRASSTIVGSGIGMVSRHWKGTAKPGQAEAYVHHLRTDTFPRLAQIPGFIRAFILKRAVEAGTEYGQFRDEGGSLRDRGNLRALQGRPLN